MGCGHNLCCTQRFHHLTISLLFLSISCTTQLRFDAEGRRHAEPGEDERGVMYVQMKMKEVREEEEKMILRGQIGSRPPRCESRCGSCGHCEAIQVPTTPQTRIATTGTKNPAAAAATIAYARGDYGSNYKPMSWKCKCGNFIFNP